MVEETRELLAPEERALGIPLGNLTEGFVVRFEEQVVLAKRFKEALIKITDAGDWKDFGGDEPPYLQDSGVHKIAHLVGVEFGEPVVVDKEGKDAKGPWIRYECALSGALPNGRTHFDIGASSTRDSFWAIKHKQAVAFEDLPLEDIKKKSVTNAQHRVLTKLLGLDGISWETLDRLGITRPKERVQFKGQERKATTGAGAWTQVKEKLKGLLLELEGGDPEAASNRLFKLTHNPEKNYRGYRDVRELSDKAAQYFLKVVEEEYRHRMEDEFDSGPAGPSSGATATKPAPREPGEDG